MRVDLGRRLQFPDVVQTTLRPDIVLWSTKDEKLVLVELTVPWEEGCEEAYERKATKYQQLAQDCRDKGWQTWLFPVEVGCRGFPSRSAWNFFSAIGLDERSKKKTVRRMGEEAEHSHSLSIMATFINGDTSFPEITAVVLLDDIQVMYYDTIVNKLVCREHNNSTAGPGLSDFKYIDHIIGFISEHMRYRAYYLRNHLNDTNNVLVLQRTVTCELLNDDQPGGMTNRDAYNGESGDVRNYNPELNTLHSHRVWPEGVNIFSADKCHFMYEYIFHPTCISLLKKYLSSERNRTLKKVKPKIRLLQKPGPGSSVRLTCLATGFYPRHINLTLLRNGQPVPDHQISGGELLPNGDETYQMRKSLEVSTEELQQHHYTCTAQHLSLDNKLDFGLENEPEGPSMAMVPSALVSLLCVTGVTAGFILWRKRNRCTVQEDTTTENASQETDSAPSPAGQTG
ncbi:major histocompatibility complex class I-related gene protein-like [Engraulis encrasicolus]|uniref:major histocompatibility complex class I-related gene protein-like n=1 Tax=Engraulis encrasicolus TaxID=184585 RepID=UPI002FD38C4E